MNGTLGDTVKCSVLHNHHCIGTLLANIILYSLYNAYSIDSVNELRIKI